MVMGLYKKIWAVCKQLLLPSKSSHLSGGLFDFQNARFGGLNLVGPDSRKKKQERKTRNFPLGEAILMLW